MTLLHESFLHNRQFLTSARSGLSQHDAATSFGSSPVPGRAADSIFICFRDSFSPTICVQLAPAPAPGGQQESFHDSSISKITTSPFSRGGGTSRLVRLCLSLRYRGS